MTLSTSLWLFQSVHVLGLAVWLSIAAYNNGRDFTGARFAVGATMSMEPLREAPAIATPMVARAASSVVLHRMALFVVLVLQASAAVACWAGCYLWVVRGDPAAARVWLNLALGGMATFLLAMHLGGLWFAYWIRQEGLQATHLLLLGWTVLLFFLFNLPWV